jgi:hypothetical protein
MRWFLISFLVVTLGVRSAPTAYCSEPASRFEDELASRGLIGSAIGDVRADARIPDPTEGTSVSEITANLASGGDQAAHAVMWEEVIADHQAEFMITTAPGGQQLFQYWILRTGGGCDLYESAVYSKERRAGDAGFLAQRSRRA